MSQESLGKYNIHPKMRVQKMENAHKGVSISPYITHYFSLYLCLNMSIALDFVRSRGVILTNIGAEGMYISLLYIQAVYPSIYSYL